MKTYQVKNLNGQEDETISRGQALSVTLPWMANSMIMLSGDVDDKGLDDILILHRKIFI